MVFYAYLRITMTTILGFQGRIYCEKIVIFQEKEKHLKLLCNKEFINKIENSCCGKELKNNVNSNILSLFWIGIILIKSISIWYQLVSKYPVCHEL